VDFPRVDAARPLSLREISGIIGVRTAIKEGK